MHYLVEPESLGIEDFKSDMARRAWQSVALENNPALSFAYLAVIRETMESPALRQARHTDGENFRSSLGRAIFKILHGAQKNSGGRMSALRQEWTSRYGLSAGSSLISSLEILGAILDGHLAATRPRFASPPPSHGAGAVQFISCDHASYPRS